MISTPIQIRFSDCDMLQHVNNAIYLQYFELARINFFKQELPNWDWKTKGIILLKNTIEYKKPVLLNDSCNITVKAIKIGRKSFTMSYELIVNSEGQQILKTYGESILVCFNFLTDQTIELPTELKDVLEKHLE
jgi:acyl-CoA thioester hydrolase